MFETFKQITNLRRAAKVDKAIGIANSAISAGQIQVANCQLEAAYKLCLETTFLRTSHINLITFWGLTGLSLKKQGHTDFADQCFKMERLLQARFDAGQFYRDP